jgi:tetratricopeptide (TPR) repeat protein
MQTEVIDYVTQRTESMMGLCYLATFYCGVRALEGRPGRWHAAAILACAAGMACKESMVTAPVMVFIYDRVFVSASARRNARRSRLYAGLATTWLILVALMLTGPRTTVGFDTPISAWTYLLNQAPVLVTYLRVAFWPRDLILDYGIPQPLTLTDVLLPMLVVVALAIAVVASIVRRPQAGFLGAWCFITLAPTSSFVPIATEVGADRRMYLPLVALVVLVVLGAYRLLIGGMQTRARVIGPAVALCLCIAFALGTIQRNREYESLLSIAQTTVDRRPHPRAYLMLGTALLEAGRRDEGMPYLERARELPGTSFVLGIAFITEGKFAAGAEELERFLRMEPMHLRAVDARESLGRAYSALNRLEPAAMHLTEVVRLEPRRGPAHAYLGEVLLRQGRVAEGLRQFQFASELQPSNPDALRLLGIAQAQTGQFDAAFATFKRAIDLDPLNGRGHYLLGSALAASGQIAAAVPHFARAVELDPQDARARDDLQRAQSYVR